MGDYDNPLDEIRGILERDRKHEIDPELSKKLVGNTTISSEKMLMNYVSDSPRVFHTTCKDIHGAHTEVHTKLSEGFKKAIPIMLIFGAVMIVALIMGNAPTIIDSLAKNFGSEKVVVTETIQQVEVVYLTPDEARAQGIEVPEAPPGITPETENREDPPQLNPVPADVHLEERDASNPRTEGFDIVGNLSPKIVPFDGGNSAENQKTCDTANGYNRYWVNSSQVPEEYRSDRSEQWLCVTNLGISIYDAGEVIPPDTIGTYEVR